MKDSKSELNKFTNTKPEDDVNHVHNMYEMKM